MLIYGYGTLGRPDQAETGALGGGFCKAAAKHGACDPCVPYFLFCSAAYATFFCRVFLKMSEKTTISDLFSTIQYYTTPHQSAYAAASKKLIMHGTGFEWVNKKMICLTGTDLQQVYGSQLRRLICHCIQESRKKNLIL